MKNDFENKSDFESENSIVISKENFLNNQEFSYFNNSVNENFNLGLECYFEEKKIFYISDSSHDCFGVSIFNEGKFFPKEDVSFFDLEKKNKNFEISEILQSFFGWGTELKNKRIANKDVVALWFYLKENLPKKGWKVYQEYYGRCSLPKKIELLFFNKVPFGIHRKYDFKVFENMLHTPYNDPFHNVFIKTNGLFTDIKEDVIIFYDLQMKVGIYIYYKDTMFPSEVDLDYRNIFPIKPCLSVFKPNCIA
jgi:hypothetical protein